jgi:hypothetical protein
MHQIMGPLGPVDEVNMNSALMAPTTYKHDDTVSLLASFVGGRVDSCFLDGS